MSRDSHIRAIIKKHGKQEARKQFQRMASFSYDGINLDHLGDEVTSIIKEAVMDMGARGLKLLEDEDKTRTFSNKVKQVFSKKYENVGKYLKDDPE